MSDIERNTMPKVSYSVCSTWNLFTTNEKRNIAIYILGIMLYKFGLEAFIGSLIALATNRYDTDAKRTGTERNTFERVGLITGLFQAFQCVGAILLVPTPYSLFFGATAHS